MQTLKLRMPQPTAGYVSQFIPLFAVPDVIELGVNRTMVTIMAMEIAADICIFTNRSITLESIDAA